jgi:nucleoside-diphosphate-sugar epimerase
MIHISTPSIYSDFKHKLGIREAEVSPKQVNSYSRTKLLAEHEVEEGARQGLETLVIRPRGIFGERDSTIFPRIIRANASAGVPLIDSGSAIVDMTYVGNVVDCVLLALSADKRHTGQAYNVTNGQPMPLRDILEDAFDLLGIPLRTRVMSFRTAYLIATASELFSRVTGRQPFLTRYSVGVLGKSQTLDITKARTELGYTPMISIHDGLRRLADWWQAR